MGRSSRHESSHRVQGRSSRDDRERSDSEEEETSRERKSREASIPADSGKRKSSSSGSRSHGKAVSGAVNGDCGRAQIAKKKERQAASASPADRRDDGEEQYSADEIEFKGEDLLEETTKTKVSTVDSKIRASRRHEGSIDGKNEPGKRKSEKDYSRKESSNHHKDGKGRERDRERDEEVRERESERHRESRSDKEKEKKTQVSRRERSQDTLTRKRGGATSSMEEDYATKRDVETDDWQREDETHNAELERDSDKQDPKRSDNYQESKNRESQRSRSKSGAHKDEKHRDGSSHRDKDREKYRDEGSRREHRREDKSKDESSRERSGSRSHSKHYRDDRKSDKRSRHHDSDYDGSPYRESSNRGRKRHSDEGDGRLDSKSRTSKEPRVNLERSASNKVFLDSQDSHHKTSPARHGEGSSLSEERQTSRSNKEKRVNESTPLTERTPSSASEPAIGSSPLTRTDNFSPVVRFGMDGPGLSSVDDDSSFKGGARYKRGVDLGVNRAATWKGVNAWPTPGVNGFIPFQPIPPPHGFLNQFPPSLFGVRPGVPFHHLHEPRPYLWPNPNDGWDEDPQHMYGRHAATWEMKSQTQTVDLVPMKESEPMTSNEQARSPAESEETRGSPERVHVAASKTEVNASFCSVYLSRLDISPYLAGSELYKQCVDLAGVADAAQTVPKFCKRRLKDFGGDSKEPISLISCFPALPETAFERAMSLYKNQTEDWRAQVGHLIHDEEKSKSKKSIISQDTQLIIPMAEEDQSPGSTATAAIRPIFPKEEQVSPAAAVTATTQLLVPKEEQVFGGADTELIIPKIEQVSGGATTADTMEEEEQATCSAAIEKCENGLMEGGGALNVSRIHDSPQSTH